MKPMLDHVIDFFVIFFADVCAAYFAIKFFESRLADRQRSEQSLSKLYKLVVELQNFYQREKAKITPHDHLAHSISGDLTEARREFSDLKDDIQFWRFSGSGSFKSVFTSILTRMQQAHNQELAGELRKRVGDLVAELDSLQKAIATKLEAKWPGRTFRYLGQIQ